MPPADKFVRRQFDDLEIRATVAETELDDRTDLSGAARCEKTMQLATSAAWPEARPHLASTLHRLDDERDA